MTDEEFDKLFEQECAEILQSLSEEDIDTLPKYDSVEELFRKIDKSK